MDLHVAGKVFLVTGASAGIGAATVRLLAAEGATVVGVARKPDGINDLGAGMSSVAADITERYTARQVVDLVLDRHDRLDGLVNKRRWPGYPVQLPGPDRRSVVSHLRAQLPRRGPDEPGRNPCAAAPRCGSLVHVASEAARFPDTPLVDYAAAQFNLPPEQAIEHFVREVRGLPAGRFGTPTMSPE
ncbi:MAG TPA: SDR family oxidoreductase [Pseudonocardiaceae bacterium]|nr:SDR family oxidoreductase [Pseudonocardiaceae bacterium]